MDLPPSIELLLGECDPKKVTFASLQKKLQDKAFVKALKDQAAYTANNYEYPGSKRAPADSEFVIHGSGGLSPLSTMGKCSSVGCREENALAFARSIGLYADYAVMTDFLTPRLYFLDPQDLGDIEGLLGDLRALHVLGPLLREGLLRLGDALGGLCPTCEKDLFAFSPTLAKEVWRYLASTAEVDFWDEPGDESTISIGSEFFGGINSPCFLPITIPSHDVKALKKKLEWRRGKKVAAEKFKLLRPLVLPTLERQAQTLLFEARESSVQRAILATESRFDAVALRTMDKAAMMPAVGEWEQVHSCRLPWISELTSEEVLRLRDQARRALPRFRARIKKDLFSLPAERTSRDAYAARLAADLQNEVPELEAELRATRVRSGKAIPVAVGLAGLTCVLYGLGSLNPQIAAAGATMLSALATLHVNHSAAEAERERLIAKPAYVLLAARDLIKHREA